tara:strand:+ start:4854 stop:6620 length:1767 start_codon:yes stop_codon:yes gene_type:complete
MARLLLKGSLSSQRSETCIYFRGPAMPEAAQNNSNGNHGPHFTIDNERLGSQNRVALHLIITDPEVCSELNAHDSEEDRNRYALSALRIGAYALRQASGAIDVHSVRDEVDSMLLSLREVLAEHSSQCTGGISNSLKDYFDPESGKITQRLNSLVKQDGELDGLLNRHLGEDSSTVAKTLALHVGEQSPLFKILSPEQSNGLLATLQEVIELALKTQRDQIVKNFSLDDKDSALSRLLIEVTDANGKLRKGLADDVAEVRNEFSLDNEEGALARLVKRVEKAQEQINDQFSQDNEDSAMSRMARLLETVNGTVKGNLTLDDENSPLSLLRRQLLDVIGQIEKTNTEFHAEIRETVAAMKARKEEKTRSTRHGDDFQDALGNYLEVDARHRGDVCERTTNTVGHIPRSKTGDFVLVMGPESIAAGGSIAIEAKQEQGYNLKSILEEISKARQNRKSEIGIFVLSQKVANEEHDLLARYGNDIVVVWDAEDPTTDVVLDSALSLARALVTRQSVVDKERTADLSKLDKAMQRIAKDATDLGEIIKWAGTITNNGTKIRDKAERLKNDLECQVQHLDEHLERLRTEPTTCV